MFHRMLATAYVLALPMLTGCGWGYAEQIERGTEARRHEPVPVVTRPPPARPAPARSMPARSMSPKSMPPSALAHAVQHHDAQLVPGARDLYTLGENHRLSLDAQGASAMAQHAFEVRLIDGINDATQLVHCASGKIIRFRTRPPDPAVQAEMERERVPPGVWVLRIDPSGQRHDLPNNDGYRHISRFHRLEFIKRADDGTVLYRYLGAREYTAVR